MPRPPPLDPPLDPSDLSYPLHCESLIRALLELRKPTVRPAIKNRLLQEEIVVTAETTRPSTILHFGMLLLTAVVF
jgi:hypothetical protein